MVFFSRRFWKTLSLRIALRTLLERLGFYSRANLTVQLGVWLRTGAIGYDFVRYPRYSSVLV